MFFDEPETIEFDAGGFGARVRKARTGAGLTQTPVAKLLGMSQATYSRMEQGRIDPERVTATLVDKLSLEFGKPMGWFLHGSPVRDRIRLAARASDTGTIRDRAEQVLDLLEADADLDAYEGADLARRTTPRWKTLAAQTAPGRVRPTRAQGVEMAAAVRAQLGRGPISDLPSLLEAELDIDTASLPLPDGLSAVAAFDDDRAVALLAVDVMEARVRQRFSLAHELGHLLASDGHVYDTGASRSPAEMRADKFAQTLLLPPAEVTTWLAERGYAAGVPVTFEDACALADTYQVSPATAWIALGDHRCAPSRPAPTSHDAALVAGHLAQFRQREAGAHIARVPQRIESRLLAAYRAGHLSSGRVAQLLDASPDDLAGDGGPAAAGRSSTGRAPATVST